MHFIVAVAYQLFFDHRALVSFIAVNAIKILDPCWIGHAHPTMIAVIIGTAPSTSVLTKSALDTKSKTFWKTAGHDP
jgi:hypothetical protein